MLRGNDNVIAWFESTKMPYWWIFQKNQDDKGVYIFRSDESEEATAGDALNELKRKLPMLSRGSFSIVASPKSKREPRGGAKVDFEIDFNSNTSQVQQPAINGPTDIDIEQRINDALNKYKTEEKLKALEKENAELKKENRELERSTNEPWNKIAGVLSPHLPQILGIKDVAAPQVAGVHGAAETVEENATVELTEKQQEIVSSFLSALAAHDTDWENTLVRITNKISTTPSVVTMIKTFI